MGKRTHVPPVDLQSYVLPPIRRTIRKRKVCNSNAGLTTPVRPSKSLRLNTEVADVDEDDEDSSSNDTTQAQHCSSKHANNSSILLNSSFKNTSAGLEQSSPATNESPRPVYTLRPSVVNGTILYDLQQKPWRLGNPIGKGNFGEIFLASDKISVPVTNENAKFVVKIEPHSNGPLFVEIHCLMNTARKRDPSSLNIKTEDEKLQEKSMNTAPSGIPDYIASGSHYFGDARYRFLVLQRFDHDLYSLIKNSCVSQKSLLSLAIQIVDVLESLHDKGYCHNDVKSQNLMISKCKYFKQKMSAETSRTAMKNSMSKYIDNYEEKQPTTDSGNSSEQEANDEDFDREFVLKRKTSNYSDEIEDDEDFDDGTTTSNSNSNSMDMYKTPVMKNRNRRRIGKTPVVQYSGSNPVRSCRRPQQSNSIYDEMVNSHYLRPSKRVSYSEFFTEDGAKPDTAGDMDSRDTNLSEDDDSIGFVPNSIRRRFAATSNQTSSAKKCNSTSRSNKSGKIASTKRLTRRQEKLEKSSHFEESTQPTVAMVPVEAEHIFLIDFGLASKYIDNGVHRSFVMDQRRAHDGTLEFTSRDAHMGAHSRRSDLESLGYNLLFWSQGFLPWKDAATQQQQEKVHRAKEYLMTDVREMLKQIYGRDVPKYLGEFLHLVGQLAYHERPQYARYRRLFEREYQQLGFMDVSMCLDSQDIARTCVRIKKDHGAGKHDIFELNHKLNNSSLLSIMKSGGTPFQERGSLADRVSPKNLRSKSDKKVARKKKFCWAEVLSQDPDQIARERAEKEFDREINYEETRPVRRYEGNPTYAILELLKKNKEQSNENVQSDGEEDAGNDEEEDVEEDAEENGDNERQEDEDEASDVECVEDEEEEEAEEEESESEDIKCSKWEKEADEDNDSDEEEEMEEEEEQEVVSSEAENSNSSCADTGDEDDDEEEEEEEEELKKQVNNTIIEVDSDEDSTSNTERFKNHLRNKKRTKNINSTSIIEIDSDEDSTSNSERFKSHLRNKKRNSTSLKKVNPKAKATKKAASTANNRSSNKSSQKKKPAKDTTTTGRTRNCTASNSKKLLKENQNKSDTKKNAKKLSRKKSSSGAASAAGEVEQQTLSRFFYEHGQNRQQQQQRQPCNNGRNGAEKEAPERRKRRCLLKTDSTEMMNGSGRMLGSGGGTVTAGVSDNDDSNSNFSPDVRILFNVWKKMSNENIYTKSAASVPNRTVATGGGGMVTRHYRK